VRKTAAEKEREQRELLNRMLAYERALYAQGVRHVAGVDEVGRGPLAGPVVAAAVVLPPDFSELGIFGINDSKKLSEKRREELFDVIRETAVVYGLGYADHQTIDEVNILEATKLAMKQAITAASAMLAQKCGDAETCRIGHVLIDALTLPDLKLPQTAIIKGDAKSVSVAAASILAKVTRDRLMQEYHALYPGYAFDRNKGYGTALHYAGLEANGMCQIHRRSFIHAESIADETNL
jgi:ribonuclease HII